MYLLKKTGFRNIVLVEIDKDPSECFRRIGQDCSPEVGRAMLVIEEVKSTYEEIKDASIRVGCNYTQLTLPHLKRLPSNSFFGIIKDTI